MNADTAALCEASLEEAPTLLEAYFWGWLLGYIEPELYLSELVITPLEGPGCQTDDFEGIP